MYLTELYPSSPKYGYKNSAKIFDCKTGTLKIGFIILYKCILFAFCIIKLKSI